MPEFHEADINLLFHKCQAGYCFKHGLWCIKSGSDRNTNKRIPKDTKPGPGEGLVSLPRLENDIQERSHNSQTLEINLSSTDSVNKSEVLCLFLFFLNQKRKDKGSY